MNGKVLLKIGIGICGLAGIGVGGYFGIRSFCRHRKAQKEQEVEYIRDDGDSWRFKGPRSASEAKDVEQAGLNEKLSEGLKTYTEKPPKDENFEEYMAAMEAPEEEDDEEEEEDPFSGLDDDNILHLPRLITASDFCNTKSYYEKVSLNYFKLDHILCDDRGNIIDDQSVINAGYFFGEGSQALDYDLVYIRNDDVETDYEVSVVNSSYQKEFPGKG